MNWLRWCIHNISLSLDTGQLSPSFLPTRKLNRPAHLFIQPEEVVRGEGIEPSLFLLGSTSLTGNRTPRLGWSITTKAPQERCSAPNTCQDGVCVVHHELLCNVERVSDHNREEGHAQPKRDISCHFESCFFSQAQRGSFNPHIL